MKLSIITINRNNAAGLEKTLQSVAVQTYKEFEYIVVDGASTDNSVEIVRRYAQQFVHFKWVSESDSGIYNAMNKGIRMATGEYIQILNSGDMLASDDVTERMLAALIEKGKPRILYGNMIKDMSGCKIKDKGTSSLHEWTMIDFVHGTVNHDPTYIHRSLYEKYGLYDEKLKICSDWKWFVRAIVFGGEQPIYVPINVTVFDMTGISETQIDKREKERRTELERMLPTGVLRDYDLYTFPMRQVARLRKYHLWKFVNVIERVLCKLEKKGWLK